MNNDIIILDVNEKNKNYSSSMTITDFTQIIGAKTTNKGNVELPDIFVVCTQHTDSSKNNFQKIFKNFAISKNYILLEEYKTGGFMSNIGIQTNIYIKNGIDNNIRNIKKDSIYIDTENSIQNVSFEYYFRKLNIMNKNNKNIDNTKIKEFINQYKNKNEIRAPLLEKHSIYSQYYVLGENNISKNPLSNISGNPLRSNTSSNTSNGSYDSNNNIRDSAIMGGSREFEKIYFDNNNLEGYYIIIPHDKSKKINSIGIININEEGECFTKDTVKQYCDSKILPLDTDLIIICSQNSISRKVDCKHFQSLVRDSIEENNNKKYQFKNKKNTSGLLNISRHTSIGSLSSLGIRTRVYLKNASDINESLLSITFKTINFFKLKSNYGSILCTIKYNGQKIHVINSCFIDDENDKYNEYVRMIREFELVKKINDKLFFVGNNITFNSNLKDNNSNLTQIKTKINDNINGTITTPNYIINTGKENSKVINVDILKIASI
jgi:hypothetical protein